MRVLALAALLGAGFAFAAHAEEAYTLTLKNHKFTPSELTIPAGKQVSITVKNEDDTAAEFESDELNREKVIQPGGSVVIKLGPLEAGSYPFEDEFHSTTARGTLVVK